MVKPRQSQQRVTSQKPMRCWVAKHDKCTIVHVSSRSTDTAHVVDVEAMKLNGVCSCEAFAFKFHKLAKEQLSEPPESRKPFRCAHIEAARNFLLNKFLREIMTPVDNSSRFNRHE